MATATRTRKAPATTAPVEPVVTMEEMEQLLRDEWNATGAVEATAKSHLDAAKIQWANTRVIRCRVAFKAAALKPGQDGKPNLLNACRILGTDPEDTPAARTAAAKKRKNTLRNYVAAGIALDEKGLAFRTDEPDAEERTIVAEAFKAGNDRTKAPTDEGKAGESDASEGGKDDTEALTVADIVGHIARLNATFKAITAASIPVSEEQAGNISEMLLEFAAQLSEYAEGK